MILADFPDDQDLIQSPELAFEVIFHFSSLYDPQFINQSHLEALQVLNLLNTREIRLRMKYLLYCKYQSRAFDPMFAGFVAGVLWLGQLQSLDELPWQPILLLVDGDSLVSLGYRLIVPRVDNEIVLSDDFRALHDNVKDGTSYILLEIVIEDLLKVDVETHELSKRLLAQEPLGLQVHLRNGLGRETAWPEIIINECFFTWWYASSVRSRISSELSSRFQPLPLPTQARAYSCEDSVSRPSLAHCW